MIGIGRGAGGKALEGIAEDMLKPYTIYYKYQVPGEKKPGPVRQFRIYAMSLEEARKLALRQGNYPNLEILRITPA